MQVRQQILIQLCALMTVDTVKKIIKIGQQKLNILYKEKWPSVGLDCFGSQCRFALLLGHYYVKVKKVKFTILH